MPHLRERYLESLLVKSLKFSPIVGVFGHRQVGKTTLVSKLAQKYITLDESATLDLINADPHSILRDSQAHPLVVDECQYSPALFPTMKEWVRKHPKPGQLLLTGSVRFSSRKAIRESLTGRIIAWELLPMNLAESHSFPLNDSLIRLAKSKTIDIELKPFPKFNLREYDKFLIQGGLPGVFAVHDAGMRTQRFETQMNTLLERDLKLIVQTTLSYRNLRNLVQILALQQNQPLELSSLSRQSRISVPTLRNLISAFEAMYLIRLIETEGTEKKPVLFFEDQGEATFLTSNRYDDLNQMTRFLFAQLRPQWVYRPEIEGSLFFQYRTRGGAFVPLCYRNKYGSLGIIPILEETPSESALASARSFLSFYPEAKAVFVHLGIRDETLTSKLRILPIAKLI